MFEFFLRKKKASEFYFSQVQTKFKLLFSFAKGKDDFMAKKKNPVLKKYAIIYNLSHKIDDGNWFFRVKPDIPFCDYEEEKYLKNLEDIYDFEENCGTAIVEAFNTLEAKMKVLLWLKEQSDKGGWVITASEEEILYSSFELWMYQHQGVESNSILDLYTDYILNEDRQCIKNIIDLFQEYDQSIRDEFILTNSQIKHIKAELLKLPKNLKNTISLFRFLNHFHLFFLDKFIK